MRLPNPLPFHIFEQLTRESDLAIQQGKQKAFEILKTPEELEKERMMKTLLSPKKTNHD